MVEEDKKDDDGKETSSDKLSDTNLLLAKLSRDSKRKEGKEAVASREGENSRNKQIDQSEFGVQERAHRQLSNRIEESKNEEVKGLLTEVTAQSKEKPIIPFSAIISQMDGIIRARGYRRVDPERRIEILNMVQNLIEAQRNPEVPDVRLNQIDRGYYSDGEKAEHLHVQERIIKATKLNKQRMRNRRVIFTEKSKDTPLMLNRAVLEGIIEETLGLPNRYMTRAREDLMYEAYNEQSDPIIESEDPYQKAVEDEQLEDGQGEIDPVQMPTLSSMREV